MSTPTAGEARGKLWVPKSLESRRTLWKHPTTAEIGAQNEPAATRSSPRSWSAVARLLSANAEAITGRDRVMTVCATIGRGGSNRQEAKRRVPGGIAGD